MTWSWAKDFGFELSSRPDSVCKDWKKEDWMNESRDKNFEENKGHEKMNNCWTVNWTISARKLEQKEWCILREEKWKRICLGRFWVKPRKLEFSFSYHGFPSHSTTLQPNQQSNINVQRVNGPTNTPTQRHVDTSDNQHNTYQTEMTQQSSIHQHFNTGHPNRRRTWTIFY